MANNSYITTYMSLPCLVSGTVPGSFSTNILDPVDNWMPTITTALSLVDQHDHSPGKGAPIAASGLPPSVGCAATMTLTNQSQVPAYGSAWFQWTSGWVAGPLNGAITQNTSTGTITPTNAGTYEIEFVGTATAISGSNASGVSIYVNGSQNFFSESTSPYIPASSGYAKTYLVGCYCVVTIAANTPITFYFLDNDANGSSSYSLAGTFSVKRLF